MDGEPKVYETTTDAEGVFIVTRPAGGSVLGVWTDDKCIEVFMHSYFDVNKGTIYVNFVGTTWGKTVSPTFDT